MPLCMAIVLLVLAVTGIVLSCRLIPTVNMWWAQTMEPRKAMATMAATMPM